MPRMTGQRCLLCGADYGEPNHLQRCGAVQVEAVPAFTFSYDPTGHSRQTDPDTSHLAAESIRATAGKRMLEALAYLQSFPGQAASCDDIEEKTGLRHQSISRRLTDLAQAGYIRDSKRRKRSRAGRLVIIWEVAR